MHVSFNCGLLISVSGWMLGKIRKNNLKLDDLNVWLFTSCDKQSKKATGGSVTLCTTCEFLFIPYTVLSLHVCLYRDREKEPKERKKGSASIWYIYASLPL